MQRRLFFRNAAGLFLAPAAMQFAGTASAATPAVSPIELPPAEDIISSFGWVTDIHYTTAPTHTIPAEDSIRVYSHSLAKLHQAIDVFNTRKLDFAIELGDFKDCTKTVDRELTIGFLQTVESAFRRYQGDRYHVMGNHDFDQISLGDYLANTNNAGDADGKTYYAFVKNGVKYIVLDACFNNDEGEHYSLGKLDWQVAIVPKMEMEWFRKELATGKEPVVVFCHQLVNTWDEKTQNIPHAFFVQNAAEVVDAMKRAAAFWPLSAATSIRAPTLNTTASTTSSIRGLLNVLSRTTLPAWCISTRTTTSTLKVSGTNVPTSARRPKTRFGKRFQPNAPFAASDSAAGCAEVFANGLRRARGGPAAAPLYSPLCSSEGAFSPLSPAF